MDAGLEGDPERRITISAKKTGKIVVVEGQRPLEEYMALPASQYSVLDADKIERLDGETFRCHVGGIKFFNFCLEPVLTLRVQPHPKGCDISMLACKLDGSDVVRAQNAKFASRMSNRVRWSVGADGVSKELVSETSVETDLQVPRWFVLPIAAIQSTGDKVMAGVLSAAVPKFLQQLERDYQVWASGDDTRKPVGTLDV